MISTKAGFFIFFLFIWLNTHGQIQLSTAEEYQSAYLNAKDLYRLEKFELAMEAFRPVTRKNSNNIFGEYASFYFAMAAYQSDKIPMAKSMLLQITEKYPEWNKIDEVNFHLSKINYESQNYFQGLLYSHRIENRYLIGQAREMKRLFISEIEDHELLLQLFEEFPNDPDIAKFLAYSIDKLPLQQKDFELLRRLVKEFRLDPVEFNVVDVKSEIKDIYKVAVLLPFMFDDLKPIRGRASNQFILDIYEGIKLAHQKLIDDGMKIELYAYDTRKEPDRTKMILQQHDLKGMDVIIGPLYPGPSKLVTEFAYQNRINLINPISNNSEVIGNNPYSFLYNPTSESMARTAAEYASANLQNKNVVIYYGEGRKDSVLAFNYMKLIERDSFNILFIEKIKRDSIQRIFKTLAATYEVPDSLDIDENRDFLDVLVIEPDSIGHLLVASDQGFIASNIISALRARGDAIQVIGSEDWLDLHFANYDVMEQMGIWFLAPNHVEKDNPFYSLFKEEYIRLNYETPSRNATSGYDLMLFIGNAFKYFGKYFQTSAHKKSFLKGWIKVGYDYRNGNDNQAIPIVQLKNSTPVIINDIKEQLESDF